VQTTTPPDVLDLRQPLRVLRRNAWLPILAAVVLGGLAYARAAREPDVYASTAVVRVLDPTLGSTLQRDRVDPAREVDIQVLYARSSTITTEVARRLGDDARRVERYQVSGEASADAIRIRAESSRPTVARRAAQTYAETYVQLRRDALASPLLDQAKRVREQSLGLQPQIQALDARIAELSPPASSSATTDSPALRSALADRSAVAERASALSDQAAQLELEASVRQAQLDVVESAPLPSDPVLPVPLRDGVLGIALGLVLGAALAFPLDRRRDLIWTTDDLPLPDNVPVLGVVPRSGRLDRFRPSRAAAIPDGSDPASEAYRTLRAGLLFRRADLAVNALLVTSPSGTRGRTATTAGLGVSIAQAGASVVVVDTDLRRAQLSQAFSLTEGPGFATVIAEQPALPKVLRRIDAITVIPGHGSLDVLPAGPTPEAPGETLLSPYVANMVTDLRESHDYVILDAPPLLDTADTLALTWLVDVVVVVVETGRSRRRDLRLTLARLQQVGAPEVGIVLTGGRRRSESGTYRRTPVSRRAPRTAGSTAGARAGRQLLPEGALE
jgi:capsular exopolysaccharide synthesis family protein